MEESAEAKEYKGSKRYVRSQTMSLNVLAGDIGRTKIEAARRKWTPKSSKNSGLRCHNEEGSDREANKQRGAEHANIQT